MKPPPTTSDLTEPQKDKQQKTPPPPWRHRVASLLWLLRFLKRPVQLFWVLLLGVIALMQFAYNYRPRLTIDASVLLDEHDPLAMLFRITNAGPWHLNAISFSCQISIPGHTLSLEGNEIFGAPGTPATGQPFIARLDPGEPATRDCGRSIPGMFRMPPYDPATLRVDITTKFHWPYVDLPDEVTRHFSARRYPDGRRVILVPDIER
jgi:hypothetical protein